MNIWTSISSKTFFQSLLDLLRTKDMPEVQMKLLGLIQKWGLNFEERKNAIPNFFGVYNKLRNSNVQFPNNYESNYQNFVSNKRGSNNYKSNYDNKNDEFEFENENGKNDKEEGETFCYMDSLKNILKVPNFQHKYRRLVNFLVKMHENIQLANLIMNSGGRSGLKDIINTLKEGNNTLIDTINGGRLKDEKLMEITLGTTEDINQTLNRNDDLKNGYKPKKFTSYFVLNNTIPIKGGNNYRSRAKSTKSKKSIQRRDDKYKNYDMDLNSYDMNKYKEKMGKAKNADDIFDLFSTNNPSNGPGHNNNNYQPISDFFSSQSQINNNNNDNQYQLRNDPINNIFNINNNNNNRSTIMMSNNNNNTNFFNGSNNNNNFNGNNNMNNNNNFGRQFNQNNNQSGPVMPNYNNNVQQSNNFNSQSMQFNQGGFNNNNSNSNNNNNNNNNLMSMLDSLAPAPQGSSNQLVPYIGNFNQNNNNQNNFMNNNNQFNNFNNNNFSNNNNNNQFNNFNNNNQMNNNNNTFDNSRGTAFMSQNMNSNNNNNNLINFNTNMSINMNNNNFGMDQNNNQQSTFEEMEKQRKLKELDDLF